MKYLRSLLGLILLFGSIQAVAMQHFVDLWTKTTIRGPIHDTFKYYLEPRLRFIDKHNKFEEASIYAGIGVVPHKWLQFYIGGAFLDLQNTADTIVTESRIYQQTNFDPYDCESFKWLTRTRLELRKREHQAQQAFRIREKFTIEIPIRDSKKYAYVLYEEGFFNINHPSWVSNRVFAENRAFAGLGIKFARGKELHVGYLNRYLIQNPHIVYQILSVEYYLQLD